MTDTQVYFAGRPLVQEYMPDEGQHRREIARVLNLVMQGKTNNSFQVTLTENTATTTIIDSRISIATSITFMPVTANAGAEMVTGLLYAVPSAGQAIIHHDNNPETDRTFNVALHG